MKDWWKETDWWIWDLNSNKMYTRSWLKPWRFSWDILGIIKTALNLSPHEALNWAEENFPTILPVNKKEIMVENKEDMREKWSCLWEVWEWDVKKYLESRKINPSLLPWVIKEWKDGKIKIPIKSEGGNIIWIQSRSLTWDRKYRYKIEWDGWGIFFDWIDWSKETLFVVEWATDYLTVRQFTSNVIWLISCKTWIQNLKSFHNAFNLIYIPDNDKAWAESVEKFEKEWLRFWTFSLDEEYWDLNDFWKAMQPSWISWWDFLKEVFDDADMPKTNLEMAFDKAVELKNVWVMSLWDDVLNKLLWWLMRWSNMLINRPSWQGKTTLSLHIMRCVLKEHVWKKIVYYSLETNVWRQLMQIIAFMAWTNEEEVFNNLNKFKPYLDKLKWLEVYDNIRSMEGIQDHINKNNVDIAFIDFAQKARVDWLTDETAKMIKYAQWMQDFAIENWHVAVISLSQTSMGNYKIPIIDRVPKSSWALFESSDSTINVGRDEWWAWKLAFLKTKNIWAKWWYTVCDTFYNPSTGEYRIMPPLDHKMYDKEWEKKIWL